MRCRSLPGKGREERKAPLAGPLSALWVDWVQPRKTDVLPIVPHQPPLCLLALLEFQETHSACVRVCAYAWACESERVALSPRGAVCECKGGVWGCVNRGSKVWSAKVSLTTQYSSHGPVTQMHKHTRERAAAHLHRLTLHTQIKGLHHRLRWRSLLPKVISHFTTTTWTSSNI